MEPLDKANSVANFITTFVHEQPFPSTIFIALVLSWCVTGFAKLWMSASTTRRRAKLWTIDIATATAIAALMLVGLFGWRWIIALALLIGFGSPFAYYITTGLIGWKWPAAKRFFTLRELAPESVGDESSSDADPPVPPTENH